MEDIRDDPIVGCIMRTGYPPWMQSGVYDEEEDFGDGDVYYGNENAAF